MSISGTNSHLNEIVCALEEAWKEKFLFSATEPYLNRGKSANEVFGDGIIPMKNWCYTISIIVARLLMKNGLESTIIISVRRKCLGLLPPTFHAFNLCHGFYIDFTNGHLHVANYPSSHKNRDENNWHRFNYDGESSISEILARKNPLLCRLFWSKYYFQYLNLRNYPHFLGGYEQIERKAQQFNSTKKVITEMSP